MKMKIIVSSENPRKGYMGREHRSVHRRPSAKCCPILRTDSIRADCVLRGDR